MELGVGFFGVFFCKYRRRFGVVGSHHVIETCGKGSRVVGDPVYAGYDLILGSRTISSNRPRVAYLPSSTKIREG